MILKLDGKLADIDVKQEYKKIKAGESELPRQMRDGIIYVMENGAEYKERKKELRGR